MASRPLVPEAILVYQSQEYRIGLLPFLPGTKKERVGVTEGGAGGDMRETAEGTG